MKVLLVSGVVQIAFDFSERGGANTVGEDTDDDFKTFMKLVKEYADDKCELRIMLDE